MRKIESMKDTVELKLDDNSASTVVVHGYTISVLVTAARCGELKKLDGIGDKRAERILQAIDEAGFILHESTMSLRMRELLAAAFYFPLGTIEEYEARVEFTEQQRVHLFKLLETLTEKEQETLEIRFGLNGTRPLNRRETADEFEVSRERVRQLEANAFRKLRHPTRKKVLMEIFPGWPGFEMKEPRWTGAYDGPLEEMPLEELRYLTVRAYNCLVRSGIETVGQLMQHTGTEIRKLRNMRFRDAENVVVSLLAAGGELKAETETGTSS